jgi:aminomethyltransferase
LPLSQFHRSLGRITDFAGFELPLWYEGIVPEHMAVRTNVGVFDVSHMGRIRIRGDQAAEFLDYVTTRQPSLLQPLQGHYTVMCNQQGGVIDDLIVYNLGNHFLMVYNAANRQKNYQWLMSHADAFNVQLEDVSDESVMYALQGPLATRLMQKITPEDISQIKRFWVNLVTISGTQVLLMRSGYTGENGFELILSDVSLEKPAEAIRLWQTILQEGKDAGIKPCGLGSRDSLRLEAGLCLYGNDLTEKITPFEAGLPFVVKLEKKKFIGKTALTQQHQEGLSQIRVGIKMVEPGIPRPEHRLYQNDIEEGYITSGGFSPILKQGIAMGYLPPRLSKIGTQLMINIRNKMSKAQITNLPFYDTAIYGARRKLVQLTS